MFYFGVDYYPEQWPEDRWPIDARLMADASFNVVRLAEFAWSKLEPKEGHFDFGWLDAAIDILHAHGMQVILGTPTGSPPPWLMRKSPDLYRVRPDGVRVTFGNRREYCPNQSLYQEYSRNIVTEMSVHYAAHPAVIGWQIDNEFGERCFCETCTRSFHLWLASRYKTLEDLNQAWGTNFWSHVYTDWCEIPAPLSIGSSPNPGLALDYDRFCSDSYSAYQQVQVEIIRKNCSGHFITHNFMGIGFDQLNYFDLARGLDLVGLDNYPRSQWSMDQGLVPSFTALNLDSTRGLKQKNFWVLEQQAGSGGWEIISVAPRPGELRLWAYQSIAHGADAILFFRWRTSRFGTEQYWHGLLDHCGFPGRRYQEIKCMGAEISRIGSQIHGSVLKSPVALLLSYDSRFAFQIQPNNPQFNYLDHIYRIYHSFENNKINIDVLSPEMDLSGYKLVVTPALHVTDEKTGMKLTEFVRAGGVLVVTQRTGVKDDHNAVVNMRLPGLLADVCGVEVEEYDSLDKTMSNALEFTIPELQKIGQPKVGTLCDILQPKTAEVLARYACDFYAGKPAVTLNKFGKGKAVYIGAVGDENLYTSLFDWLLRDCGTQPILDVPKCLEVTERLNGEKRFIFVLNHGNSPQVIWPGGELSDLISGASVKGELEIPPHDVRILVEQLG